VPPHSPCRLLNTKRTLHTHAPGTHSRNKLTGTLPESWSEWPLLGQLWLFQNQLSGPLPAAWGSAWTQARDISINDNQLTGPVPATWGSLGRTLSTLYLANNPKLSGCLPKGLERFARVADVCDGTALCAACP